MTGKDGTTIRSSPDGSSDIFYRDGSMLSDYADGSRTASNPDGSFFELDRNGTWAYRSPTGERLTWSERDEKWIVFDRKLHGSQWERDAATGRWTERDSPHPTRPEGVWNSPDGRTTITERNGHLFARSDEKYFIRYGGELGLGGPDAGQWQDVTRTIYASTLASNEMLDAEQANTGLTESQAYTDALNAATQSFQVMYMRIAERLGRVVGGPVGKVFEWTMDNLSTYDDLQRATTDAERMQILADAMEPSLPSIPRFGGRKEGTPTPGTGHKPDSGQLPTGENGPQPRSGQALVDKAEGVTPRLTRFPPGPDGPPQEMHVRGEEMPEGLTVRDEGWFTKTPDYGDAYTGFHDPHTSSASASESLRRNLGPGPENSHAHHIIPDKEGGKALDPLREKLAENYINPNGAENGVYLVGTSSAPNPEGTVPHTTYLHSGNRNDYLFTVRNRLMDKSGPNFENELAMIKNELSNGLFRFDKAPKGWPPK